MSIRSQEENKRENAELVESVIAKESGNPDSQFIDDNKDKAGSFYECTLTISRVYGKCYGNEDLEEPKTLLPVGGKATYLVTPVYHELAIRKDAKTAELHFDLLTVMNCVLSSGQKTVQMRNGSSLL